MNETVAHDVVAEMLADKQPITKDALRLRLVNQSFIQLMRNSRDFRRFVWHLLGECGFTQQPFTGQRETTDFNCGKRETGRILFLMIDEFCPDHFSIMMKEAKEDLNYDHGQLSTSSPGSSASGSTPSTSSPGGNPTGGADSIAILASPGSGI